MTNRLAHENSPYLLQHKNNPVDWHPWGPEALEKSRQTGKPIFLSIGYAACHWCHVMEHESFEDEKTAALMNELFVNIKVDREERPDLDDIYMQAVVAMTGQGGWPMSVFLTPDLAPFYGGTYFPPVRRYNMPSFREVLMGVSNAWKTDREKVLEQAGRLTGHIRNQTAALSMPEGALSQAVSEQAALTLAQNYDWKKGGWGQAPKFPQPMAIEFLLRLATRGDKMALDMASHALDSMAKGGMYDVVGGGFARYSVDDEWLVPHFEKMLYDNAQLALAYLHAWKVTEKPVYKRVVVETLEFVAREMSQPEGGFYSSLDADSEGEEGKFYVWTPAEVRAALPEDLAHLVITAYGISEGGNFEGQNILQRVMDEDEIAGSVGLPVEKILIKLQEAHRHMLAYRSGRIRPGTDDKVLVSWNGMMLAAFAEAGRYLGEDRYIEVAMRNADFLLTHLIDENGRLLRAWRNGQAAHNAFLEDYGALIIGLLALYQSDPQPRWFRTAIQLAETMIHLFKDPDGGFFDTGSDHEQLLVRPKNLQDNATPSGGSLAVTALLQLAAFTANGAFRDQAENALKALQPALGQYPTAFANWLCAFDFALGPVNEVAIVGDISGTMAKALWDSYRPRQVAAIAPFPPGPDSPPLLLDRPMLEGLPTAYVCQGFICQQPVNKPEDLRSQL